MYGSSNVISSKFISTSCYIPNRNEFHACMDCLHIKMNLNDKKVCRLGGFGLVNFAEILYIESVDKLSEYVWSRMCMTYVMTYAMTYAVTYAMAHATKNVMML